MRPRTLALPLTLVITLLGCAARPQRVGPNTAKPERSSVVSERGLAAAKPAPAPARPAEECARGEGAAQCFERAWVLYDSERPEDGTEAWRLADVACSADHARACRLVGWILQEHAPYQGADERAKNLSEAREYFTKACALGDGGGCNNLGWLAMQGWGGVTDHALARKVFASSCASDGGPACRHLGDLHADGRGGPVDAQQATHFYLLALDTFATECEKTGEQCDFLAAGSTHWKLRTAEAKRILEARCREHEEACFALAIYLHRTGDKAGAEREWEKACERANDAACQRLGESLLSAGRPRDARKWLERGCTLNVSSCFTLAEALREKKIKQETKNEFVSVYAGACDRGHPHACLYGGSVEARERGKRLLEAECHAEHSEEACVNLRRLESLPAEQAR